MILYNILYRIYYKYNKFHQTVPLQKFQYNRDII